MNLFDLLRKQDELEARVAAAEAELALMKEARERMEAERAAVPLPAGMYL